jgi:galactokinase
VRWYISWPKVISGCALINLALVNLGLTHLGSSNLGDFTAPTLVSVPGRVNLIGEHIDYHDLPVLPMAIQRRVRITFHPRADTMVRAISSGVYGKREFALARDLEPGPIGDWGNYLKAAAQAALGRWPLQRGIDAMIDSDLPAAAGLASSSALLAGFTLALLQANRILATVGDLMDILPDGEQFVGTRGGGMDHAAVLASRAGCALLVRFAPLELSSIAVPPDWRVLVAHSLTMAEKSGAARSEYNARRTAGTRALTALGLPSYPSAVETYSARELTAMAEAAVAEHRLAPDEFRAFIHVTSEAERVNKAVAALRQADVRTFGQLLSQSHVSLRDNLRVSAPALDELVETAIAAGALGARLTGAGFGGCAVILCRAAEVDRVRKRLVDRYYSQRPGFDPENHLIMAERSAGALYDTSEPSKTEQPPLGAGL